MSESYNELDTLNHLRISPIGAALQQILKKRLLACDEALRNATDSNLMFRMQGKAQALADLLAEIESSRDQIQRQASRPKGQL